MSKSDKKDLTRIEDLGEFIHAEEEEVPTEEDFSSSELESEPEFTATESFQATEGPLEESSEFPELPAEEPQEEAPAFESDFTLSSEEPAFTEEAFVPEETPPEEPLIIEESTPDLSFTETEEIAPVIPELKPEPVFTPPPMQEYKAPENFDDIKKFSENTSFTGMSAEGNPSFSVLIKNVRYIEDVNDIMILMKELGLIADSEDQMRARLMRGSLLVPRISEYAAIFLAHKLRRFDIDIQVGLSDDIHPPKHQEAPEVGMVSKFNLYQNQTHHFQFDDPKLDISQILVSATPNLEGYQVVRYLGVASEHKMLEGHVVEDEDSSDIPLHYQELAQKLKAHALKANSNAVVGINYQLTPIPSEMGQGHKYRLSCTGNLVWVNKL